MKLGELRARTVALALCVFGVAWIVVDIVTDRLDSRAPTIATTALAIALTITVLERIIQRENRRAFQPRIDRALAVLAFEVKKRALECVADYASRHVGEDVPEIWSDDPLAVLAAWQDRYKKTSDPRIARWLLRRCEEFVRKVQPIVDANRDVLPPDVVAAADNVSQPFGGMGPSFDEHLEETAGTTGGAHWLALVVVESARGLGQALRNHDAHSRARVDPDHGRHRHRLGHRPARRASPRGRRRCLIGIVPYGCAAGPHR